MLLKDFWRDSISALGSLYPEAEARSIVTILCENLLGVKSYTHIVDPGYEIPEALQETLESAMARLLKAEPVQYVTGQTVFCDRVFRVTPDVLIPRPETEALVAEAVKTASRLFRSSFGKAAIRVLDLCTGSGCIAWSIALAVPGVEVVGVDVSPEALEVARTQDFARELKETGAKAPQFVEANILAEEIPVTGEFDVIVSNPPYVLDSQKSSMRRNVLDYEPLIALFVPAETPVLFYEAIGRLSKTLLKQGGKGLVEINELLALEVETALHSQGFPYTTVAKDIFNKNRIVSFSRKSF